MTPYAWACLFVIAVCALGFVAMLPGLIADLTRKDTRP